METERRMRLSWVLFALNGLVLVICMSQAVRAAITTEEIKDFTHTTYQELQRDILVKEFSKSGVIDYSQVATDIPRDQVVVGARDHLIRLDVETLKELEIIEWKSNSMQKTLCTAKRKPREDCHNFIRVLLMKDDKLFACGTNAFTPLCSWREAGNLSMVEETLSGVAKCPYSPHHNTTAVMTKDGHLYSGTLTDFTARDPAITRQMGGSKFLRTVQYNTRWLNEPDFVSSYEIDDYIYFFFREAAIEYINCGKLVYPRVARICKSDTGGNFLLEHNFISFSKARLNCSLPGDYPFYFHELQSTYFMEDQQLVYAVFSTAATSIYGSAVCVYNMTSFNTAFGGPFKYQENTNMAWARVPNNVPMECSAPLSSKRSAAANSTPAQRHLVDAQKFQMMDDAVQPLTELPLIVEEGARFSHLAVDGVFSKHHKTFNVVFLATLEGSVKKLVKLPELNHSCLIEEMEVIPKESHKAIHSFKLSKEQGALFVGTNNKLFRIPVQRCSRFPNKIMCMNAKDPYCGWHDITKQCTSIPEKLPDPHWHQNIDSCPIIEYPVDGGWSDWSKWAECRHTGDVKFSDQCVCRRRICDSPAPAFGGKRCRGDDVEVTNCTVNGGWTEWSDWSGCSATCDVGIMTRGRTCSNPEPRFGGRVCVGNDRDEQYCHDNPPCPAPTRSPIDGKWTNWSDWTLCSKKCGGGMQNKRRACTNPPPRYNGIPCIGNDITWKSCNEHPCDEVRKTSAWTHWVRTNNTKEGYVEERFRMVCKATVDDPRDIRFNVKNEVRFCSDGGHDCIEPGRMADIDGGWSPWSEWSECDLLCDGGSQWREKTCSNPPPSGFGRDCQGHSREKRICNVHSCQGQWSCWSDFSPCSMSCGQGKKFRKRHCQASVVGGHYTIPCFGTDKEDLPCTMPPCNPYDGWDQWTLWSECFSDNAQKRNRKCKLTFPDKSQCNGPDEEARMCIFGNSIPNVAREVREDGSGQPMQNSAYFKIYHLIIVGIIGFILGGVVCVGIFLYCQRQHKENKEQEKYNTLQRCDVKQNDYISPSELDLIHPVKMANHDNSLNKYYSTASLKKKDKNQMTVKEATLKRNSSLMRTNSMRTNLETPLAEL